MRTRRLIVWSAASATFVAGLIAIMPQGRHSVRHMIASHSHVRFGRSTATPVVSIQQSLPQASAREPDLRFTSVAVADATTVQLTPPQLDPTALAGPTRTTLGAIPLGSPPPPVASLEHPAEQTQGGSPPDNEFAVDLAGARQALIDFHNNDLVGGDEFAHLTGGTLRTALEWAAIRLDSHDAGLSRLQAFVAAHGQWPMLPWINRRIEESKAAVSDPAAVLALFTSSPPQTLGGTLSLARACLATGDAGRAATLVQGIWRATDLTASEEFTILHEFGGLLRKEDHKARADRLLYKENVPAALRAAALAGPDVTALIRARAAVLASAPSDAAMAAVPKLLQGDPGLLFARIQKARRSGLIDQAAALIQTAPQDQNSLIDGDAWWVERRLVARKLLDAGNLKSAYLVAAGERADSPASKIEGEFHAGWIALRFLKDPALAAKHFANVSQIAETPISNARGAYWQGRAAEAAGNTDAAATFYAAAAGLPTTFYGQLAAAKLGRDAYAVRDTATPAVGTARSEAVRCVAALFALGERELAVSLALAIAKTESDQAQVASLAAVVEATNDARATLIVGKAAAQRGIPLDQAAFPTFGVPGYQPIEHSADRATVLAIARQESEFDPRSISSAGAKGLMQMIDSTARRTASDAGIGFDEGRLLTDAAFNARLGAAHLGKLLNDLDGSYILTFAAYNAGAGKVRDWIAAYGDPRKPGVDPIDWIERIPFTETRNYVQRVFENLQIYRTQLGMPKAVLTASQLPLAGKGT